MNLGVGFGVGGPRREFEGEFGGRVSEGEFRRASFGAIVADRSASWCLEDTLAIPK